MPLDYIKFAMKATVIKKIRERKAAKPIKPTGEELLSRTQSRAASIHESMYSNVRAFHLLVASPLLMKFLNTACQLH
jgi:H+-transporting ATPase